MAENPFTSIESAQEYMHLLISAAAGARTEIQTDIAEALQQGATRRDEALQLVDYKLKLLDQHLCASSRILNDLRLLRRVLETPVDEPAGTPGATNQSLHIKS